MQSDIQIFNNPDFGQVRTITDPQGETWFIAIDLANSLGYQNGSRDINRHVEPEDRTKLMISDGTQRKETIVINESGLYALILSSKLPTARQFKRWVTADVLPTIRRHGAYATPDTIARLLADPDNGIRLLQALKAEREEKRLLKAENARQQQLLQQQQPKVIFADAVACSDRDILIGELAKIIKQNGTPMGQNRLFRWLRLNDYLCSAKGDRWNQPTQRAMELGLFRIKKTSINQPDGVAITKNTTKVTPKGQVYFINIFNN